MMQPLKHWVIAGALTLLGTTSALAETRVLVWDDLVPEDSKGAQAEFLAAQQMVTHLGADPSLQPLSEKLTATVQELDGQHVQLSGYAVPIEGHEMITTFLLVPYQGACIHVPPPPPNQLVMVEFPEGVPYEDTWEPLKLEGTMQVGSADSGLGQFGYTIQASKVEVFETYEDYRYEIVEEASGGE